MHTLFNAKDIVNTKSCIRSSVPRTFYTECFVPCPPPCLPPPCSRRAHSSALSPAARVRLLLFIFKLFVCNLEGTSDNAVSSAGLQTSRVLVRTCSLVRVAMLFSRTRSGFRRVRSPSIVLPPLGVCDAVVLICLSRFPIENRPRFFVHKLLGTTTKF